MKLIPMKLILAVSMAAALGAQAAPPSTEVFLAPLAMTGDAIAVGAPVNITSNAGYDNQPSWLPDSSGILLASERDGKQNDIYRYDLKTRQLAQLTRTAENEYSPLVAPDGRSFLCVHGTEQSIFRYDMDGGHPRLAFQYGTALIGYHVWTSETEFAAFVLGAGGAPNTLQVINTATGTGVTIESNIGRSLLRRPDANTISFVSKATPDRWVIKEFDIRTHAVTAITDAVPRSEDLTWLPDGRILMGSGSKLFMWKSGAAGWTEIADLAAAGVRRITRLSASRDGQHLAIVGES